LNITELTKKNDKNLTALHIASKEGYRDVVHEIILYLKSLNYTEKNLIISQQDDKNWTPLFYSIDGSENGFPDIVGIKLLTIQSL